MQKSKHSAAFLLIWGAMACGAEDPAPDADAAGTGVKDAHEFNSDTDQGTANITAGTDNTYTNTSGVKETGGGGPAIGTLPYSYTADAASAVSAAVQSGAGPK